MINSSRPSDVSMQNQVMVGADNGVSPRLFGGEPLPEMMLTFCKLDH